MSHPHSYEWLESRLPATALRTATSNAHSKPYTHGYCNDDCYANGDCRYDWYSSPAQADTSSTPAATHTHTNCYRNTIPYANAERYAPSDTAASTNPTTTSIAFTR